ncbi:LPXTG cell wall anchor domain-containing protein [Kitasatospora aburaviensis]
MSPPEGYAAPEVTVFGPLVLNADNLDAGVEVTAVNRLIPTPTPTPTPTATPTGTSSPTPTGQPTPTPAPTGPAPAVPAPTMPPPAPPAVPAPVPGSHLPSTGAGQGIPVMLAGAGTLTVLGAALVLVARRRRAGQQ